MSELPDPYTLHSEFAFSRHGRWLAQNTRFNVFKPEWVGTELWVDLIGPDVNNLHHMPHTRKMVSQFCVDADLSYESQVLLETTAITHDWGEALIGDIDLPSKTAEDEKRELVAYRQIATELFPYHSDELTEKVWGVLNKTDAEHGDMFRAIEYVGYCTSAMRAGHAAVRLAHGFKRLDVPRLQKEQLIGGLLSMESAVRIHNFPILSKYVETYPELERQIQI